MKALAQAAPTQISAGVGNLKVVAYSGLTGEKYWVYMDITEGSYGGRIGKDGLDCVDTLYANTNASKAGCSFGHGVNTSNLNNLITHFNTTPSGSQRRADLLEVDSKSELNSAGNSL